ncbi:DUF4386 domain-containing protein [Paenibacillus sp. Soil724D2]|uniref:DUF4386 domain-containing protein n=1 Tax=Paenibacillus sp. (strain Soil724D2) TaxID=1736392 RepID=UPI00071511FA|nr:DUF4386 domain-containing protein [Paenibacillus sp. Soil724D2]KRE48916.1 hypothetical protein ASG85_25740 [Paenibacillus sp. Soil724D2]
MISNKKTARIVGVLFLAATAAYILGNGLIESILKDPDYLIHVYPNKTKVVIGMLLELMNSAAAVGIAITLFPILKKHNETIALGYVAFRGIEAIILIVGAISPLLLISLSQEYIEAGAPDTSYFQTIGMLAIKGKFLTFQLAMIVLGLYSLLFCYLLYQSKLIPRLISVFGIIGYVALLTSALLEVFGYSAGMILFLPGALFEIIFPIWLIVKGFNSFTLKPNQ